MIRNLRLERTDRRSTRAVTPASLPLKRRGDIARREGEVRKCLTSLPISRLRLTIDAPQGFKRSGSRSWPRGKIVSANR